MTNTRASSVIRWIGDKYKASRAAQFVGKVVHEYGPSYVVADWTIGIGLMLVIYFILLAMGTTVNAPRQQQIFKTHTHIHTGVDAGAVADYFGLSPSMRAMVDEYGLIVAAWSIMKALFPLRIVLEIALIRRIHKPVNRFLGPLWDAVFGSNFATRDNETNATASQEMINISSATNNQHVAVPIDDHDDDLNNNNNDDDANDNDNLVPKKNIINNNHHDDDDDDDDLNHWGRWSEAADLVVHSSSSFVEETTSDTVTLVESNLNNASNERQQYISDNSRTKDFHITR
ncbi:hypothetical protein HK100_009977, partial [Physocladia obscura]